MKKFIPYLLELGAIIGVATAGWRIYKPLGIMLASVGAYYYAQGLK